MDALFARMSVSSGNEAWYLVDMLGTVRDIRDQAFADIYHAEFDSYGIITEGTGSGGDRYKWTGREWQARVPTRPRRGLPTLPPPPPRPAKHPPGKDSLVDSPISRKIVQAAMTRASAAGSVRTRSVSTRGMGICIGM